MGSLHPVKRKVFEKFLRYIGCTHTRTKGDHLIYTREDLKRPVVITKDKEIPVFHIRTNLRTLGIDKDEFLEILRSM